MYINSSRELNGMVESLKKRLHSSSSPLYFDTETTGLDPYTCKIVTLQFHFDGDTYIVDMRRVCTDRARKRIGEVLRPIVSSALWVGHNLKFDMKFLMHQLGVVPGQIWDTQIAEQVIYGLGLSDGHNKGIEFNLKAVAARYGAGEMSKEERSWFINLDKPRRFYSDGSYSFDTEDGVSWFHANHTAYKRDEPRPKEAPVRESDEQWAAPFPDIQTRYMELDVEVLPTIYEKQREKIEAKGLAGCMALEMRVLPALAWTELGGVLIDVDAWRAVIAEKEVEAKELENQALEIFAPAILEARTRAFDPAYEKYKAWEDERKEFEAACKTQWEYELNLFPDDKDYAKEFKKSRPWGKYKTTQLAQWERDNPRPFKQKPKLDTKTPNMNSSDQLMQAFEIMGIDAKDTNKQTLTALKDEYPEISLLLEYRAAAKFSQSFGENLLALINEVSGRIHPDFQQIGASTNRMSCIKPNWQQIPSRSKTGKKLRACVKARPGYKLLVADFSSQELAVIAFITGDKKMREFFAQGVDLHVGTARMMFNLDELVNTKEYMVAAGVSARDAAKAINYGIAYGMTKYRLAHDLKIDTDEAQELIDRWLEPYSGVRKWLDDRKKEVKRKLRSTTLHGWVRHYDPLPPEPVSYYGMSREEYKEYKKALKDWKKKVNSLENRAMNTPIQGSAAGITKLAVSLFYERVYLSNLTSLKESDKLPVQLIAVVHDELVVEVREDLAEEMGKVLCGCMDEAMGHFLENMPMPATDVKISDHWEK